MFKNYLKTAWRSLKKNKIYTFINIFGLSAGLACCLLISLYLNNELHYDAYQKNYKDLYQLGTIFTFQHKESAFASTPAPMGEAMKKEYPEVLETTRLFGLQEEDKTLLQNRGTNGSVLGSFYESNGFLADSTFFRMFTYDFTEGDPATALVNPLTIVISEEIAKKMFGNAPALNKVIHVSSTGNGDYDFQVTGVFRDMRSPSHINGHFFMSMYGGDIGTFAIRHANDFATDNMFYTYLQLRPGADAKKLEAKFPAFIEKYAAKDLKNLGFDKRQFLMPIGDIHLLTGIQHMVSASGSKTYLYILSSIAVFTLIIACINFMNLATARSSKRSAEIGMRKVLGAGKKRLIWQFLGESLILALLAYVFACVIAFLLTPLFSAMTGSAYPLSLTDNLWLVIAFLGIAIVTGILAGLYPAFYLSSFNPVLVLRGKLGRSFGVISLRKVLVVFQFVISIGLIISAVVINDQMQYMRTKDLGFDRMNQIVIPLRSKTAKDIYPALKTEIGGNQLAASVGASYYYPGVPTLSEIFLYRSGENVDDAKRIMINYIDNSFLQTLNIHAIAGRLFSRDFTGDAANNGVVLNQTAVRTLGFRSPEEAIGQKVLNSWQGNLNTFLVVGVVKDFNFEDLHLPIGSYGFFLNRGSQYNYMMVHARPGNLAGLLSLLASTWKSLNPNEPLETSFVDQDIQKNYKAETQLSDMIQYFMVMAIIISCLGLFGLASFSIEQRVKEIGIRKVLGATVSGIIFVISREFLKLVGIACIIAAPLAWYLMNHWLQDFAYRTRVHWTVFLLSFLLTFFIAGLTIIFQAYSAARTNPVKSIRRE